MNLKMAYDWFDRKWIRVVLRVNGVEGGLRDQVFIQGCNP